MENKIPDELLDVFRCDLLKNLYLCCIINNFSLS